MSNHKYLEVLITAVDNSKEDSNKYIQSYTLIRREPNILDNKYNFIKAVNRMKNSIYKSSNKEDINILTISVLFGHGNSLHDYNSHLNERGDYSELFNKWYYDDSTNIEVDEANRRGNVISSETRFRLPNEPVFEDFYIYSQYFYLLSIL